MLNLLRREWQLEDLDDQPAPGERIRHHLKRATVPGDDAPYLLRLFGVTPDTNAVAALTPEDVRERTFAALRRLLLAGAGSVVLAIEDLHWIDRTSEEFLASFAESVPAAPVLFVTTYRPGYRPPWIERSYVSQLALPPLSPSESRAVVDAFIETSRVDSAISDSIIGRGDGNPFFLEELALAASHQHGLEAGTVPATVHEVLDARFDRLPEPLQRVLDTAAVLGRESSILLLEKMLQRPSWLPAALKELVGLEFLHERPARRLYSFRHALIREAILERLSTSDRKTLHERAAHVLEDIYQTRLDEVTDQLAFHYSQTDVDAKAIEYLMRFGDRAIANYALSEGVAAFEEALAKAWHQAQDGQSIVLALSMRLAFPLLFLGRPEAARDALLRCREQVETCGSPQQRGDFYFRLGAAYDHLADYPNAIPAARLAIREWTHADDGATVAKAQIILMHADLWAGDYKAGLANAEIATTAFKKARDPSWHGVARWTEGWLHIQLGDFEAAAAAQTDILAAAAQSGYRRLEYCGHALAGWISIRRGELMEGIEACQHALLCAPDPLAKAIALTILGEGQIRAGDVHGALANLTVAHRMSHQFAMPHGEFWATGHLIDVHIKLRELEVAQELALKLESFSKGSGFRSLEGLARRGLGRVALSRGLADMAESHLRLAADRFAHLGARYDLANTHLDLAATAALKNDEYLERKYILKARRLFRLMNALAPVADPALG